MTGWHQLDHMQIICTSLQTDNHLTTQFFTGRLPFLPPNQQHQRIECKLQDYRPNTATLLMGRPQVESGCGYRTRLLFTETDLKVANDADAECR